MTSVVLNGIKIIPIHLNTIFLSESLSVDSNLSREKLEHIFQDIYGEPIICDFNYIDDTLTSSTYEKLVEGIEGEQVKLVNLNENIHKAIMLYANKGTVVDTSNNGRYSICTTKFLKYNKKELLDDTLANHKYLLEEIISACENSISHKKTMISSNVYTNRHFDLTKLFTKNKIVRIMVYILIIKIRKDYPNGSLVNIKLISSSDNGGILATMLGVVLGYEHIAIPQIGSPRIIGTEDYRYLDLIKPNDELIYIYDFIALGNEQRVLCTIAQLAGAKVIASMGLSFFRPWVNAEKSTQGIIQYNEIFDDIHFAAPEEDINTFVERDVKNERATRI